MKHFLLGTTALVAAGLVAAEAMAAEPLKLGIGGWAMGAAGAVVDEDDAVGPPTEGGAFRSDVRFRWNTEIHFKGETTLDNGITVGARIELEGANSGDQIDEAFIDFSGGFGTVRFGQEDEAVLAFCVGDPGNVTRNFGANSPFHSFTNEGTFGVVSGGAFSIGTCFGVAGDDLELLYFSPTFAGFNFGVSYKPNAPDQDVGPGSGTFAKGGGAQRDIVSVGANFSREFDGVSLLIGGGASAILNDDTDSDEAEYYELGIQVGFGNFKVGAAGELGTEYQDTFGAPVSSTADYWVAQAGASYTFEAWAVGIEWTHGEFEITGSSNEDTVDYISLNGAYTLGPGMALEAQVGYTTYDDDDGIGSGGPGTTAEYDGVQIATGFVIDF